jgi:hypothetical protein
MVRIPVHRKDYGRGGFLSGKILMKTESATDTRMTVNTRFYNENERSKTTKTLTTRTITNHAWPRSHHSATRFSLFALRVLELDALMQTNKGRWSRT